MGKELVVITGATGFIGGRVLQILLQQNYNVRIVVRSNEKKQNSPSFQISWLLVLWTPPRPVHTPSYISHRPSHSTGTSRQSVSTMS
jgi:nucleoside-diphosphate-sugar epimerase